MLVLALAQGQHTVQPVLRASRGVPGGAALEKADDFVNRGLLVLMGPPGFEGKNVRFTFSVACEVPQDSSVHLGQEPEPPFLHPSSLGAPCLPVDAVGCPGRLSYTKGKQEGRESQVSCKTCQHHTCLGMGVLPAVTLSPRGVSGHHQQQGCGGNLCSLHVLGHLE